MCVSTPLATSSLVFIKVILHCFFSVIVTWTSYFSLLRRKSLPSNEKKKNSEKTDKSGLYHHTSFFLTLTYSLYNVLLFLQRYQLAKEIFVFLLTPSSFLYVSHHNHNPCSTFRKKVNLESADYSIIRTRKK